MSACKQFGQAERDIYEAHSWKCGENGCADTDEIASALGLTKREAGSRIGGMVRRGLLAYAYPDWGEPGYQVTAEGLKQAEEARSRTVSIWAEPADRLSRTESPEWRRTMSETKLIGGAPDGLDVTPSPQRPEATWACPRCGVVDPVRDGSFITCGGTTNWKGCGRLPQHARHASALSGVRVEPNEEGDGNG